ncbi:hypothetical protein H2203_008627 [Taxawa tesnikishii (nom. ined.)]|nr:hypothetical protein H2203_008627 [Dothideales sp. JES 119]
MEMTTSQCDLWRKSVFTLDDAPKQNLFSDLSLDLNLLSDNPYSEPTPELRLPDLDAFQFAPLENVTLPESKREKTGSERGIRTQDTEEDVWALDLSKDIGDAPRLRTWEAFLDEKHDEPQSAYLSETGPRAFDAALHAESTPSGSGKVLQPAFVLKALLAMAQGRGSTLFQWDDRKHTFAPTLADVRVSGCSLSSTQSLVKYVIEAGNSTMQLERFVTKTYSARTPLPARVALAGCVETVLRAVECYWSTNLRTIHSFICLQTGIRLPTQLLQMMRGLVDGTASARSNYELATEVNRLVRSSAGTIFRDIHYSILTRVSQPLLQSVRRATGLSQGTADDLSGDDALEGLLSKFQPSASLDESAAATRFVLAASSDLLRAEDALLITDVRTALQILRQRAPSHPILNPLSWSIGPTEPQLSMSSLDLERILGNAQRYEAELITALQQYRNGQSGKVLDYGRKEDAANTTTQEIHAWEDDARQQQYFADVGARFSEFPETAQGTLPDELQELVGSALSGASSDLSTPNDLDIAPASSPVQLLRPYLNVQSRVVNASILRLLFRECNLRQHLDLQHSFHLFSNAYFLDKLTSALFSADLESAERQPGRVHTSSVMGLRLDARDGQRWPPASSELRLSLMGILWDSYDGKQSGSDQLPGDLSFSIRELSEAEIERCTGPLHSIITQASLQKYDDIFRSLLRLLRLMHLITLNKANLSTRGRTDGSDGLQAARAFATEAHHVLSTLASHVFSIGISTPWATFTAQLDAIEADMATEDKDGVFGTRARIGVQGLCELHNQALDSIRTRMFVRRKQEKLQVSMNRIFTIILQASQSMRRSDTGGEAEQLRKMHGDFRAEVKRFLGLLEDASGRAIRRKGRVAGVGSAEREDMESLGLLRSRLDMSGFYAAKEETRGYEWDETFVH